MMTQFYDYVPLSMLLYVLITQCAHEAPPQRHSSGGPPQWQTWKGQLPSIGLIVSQCHHSTLYLHTSHDY